MPDPFEEILWKIRWSEQHFEVLEKTAIEFLETQFYHTRSDTDRQNRLVMRVTHVDPMPPELSLLIGDTAHNLHTALDHLIWLFARPTPEQERSVQFPIVYARKHFAAEARRRMPGVGPRVKALVKRLQPYHRGKWPETALLGYIKEIDNWDKHRALTPVTGFVESMPMEVTSTGAAVVIGNKTLRGRLKPGAVLSRIQMSEAVEGEKVTVNAKPDLVPVFDDRMPKKVGGRPVIATLREAGLFLRHEVVPRFRPLLK